MLATAAFLLTLFAPGTTPAAPAADRTVVVDSVFAPALGVWKRVLVYLPASYETETTRRYPVAYYLHGYSGSESDWIARVHIDSAAAALAARGGPEMILVMPDADDGWYVNWVEGEPYETCAARRGASAPTYCVKSSNYADYIVRDVITFVDTKYRTRADRAHRGVAGLSMGGYGALKLALQYPAVFGAAASHAGVVSPLLNGVNADDTPIYAAKIDSVFMLNRGFRIPFKRALGTDVAVWQANDPAALVRILLQTKTKLPALYIDCGTQDNLIWSNRALHRDLEVLKVRHEYREFPGAHTWEYWRARSNDSVTWLASVIAKD